MGFRILGVGGAITIILLIVGAWLGSTWLWVAIFAGAITLVLDEVFRKPAPQVTESPPQDKLPGIVPAGKVIVVQYGDCKGSGYESFDSGQSVLARSGEWHVLGPDEHCEVVTINGKQWFNQYRITNIDGHAVARKVHSDVPF